MRRSFSDLSNHLAVHEFPVRSPRLLLVREEMKTVVHDDTPHPNIGRIEAYAFDVFSGNLIWH
jgi:hypothetical protein